MTNNHKLTFSSLCLICCFALPFLAYQNPQAAQTLCLMHFPVMVCGMMCGAPWGVAVGVTAPILRSLTFGMPAMFPDACAMCIEMGVYGLVCGLEANDPRRESTKIFFDLIIAMIAGRIAWGITMMFLAYFSITTFSLQDFINGVTITWPGIALQLIALPPLIVFLQTIYYPDEIREI